jgi:uncharacterized protein with NAD-binding domain and iron-sulfur cluster
MPRRSRVAILGGGIAGLAAAWELSRPEQRDSVGSITVYQRGWRLGGKGASSRGVHGRIEEHGLHVWLGYYENAFRLMRECYAELDRPRTDPGSPVLRWDDAFRPASTIGLGEQHGAEWLHWIARFGENDERPGDPDRDATPMTATELVGRAVALLRDFGTSLADRAEPERPTLVLTTDPFPPELADRKPPTAVGGLVADAALVAALAVLSAVDAVRPSARTLGDRAVAIVDAIDVVVARLHDDLDRRVHDDDSARRTWQFVDLVRVIVRGILADRLLDRPEGYGAVDDEDYREWLVRHGARPETVASPLVRVVYDLVFGYEDGDDARPRFAAGTGLLLSGKMFFDYRGAIFWKMTAGMGDVVFAPLHDALRARGVEFRFFHRVDALRTSADGQRIDAIELGVQACPRDDTPDYDPLVDVGGLRCWPSSPRRELLRWAGDDLGDELGGDLESHWSRTPDVESLVLRAGEHFDAVVLAIPVGMHHLVCSDLLANPRTPQWRAMVDHLGTVATQSVQLWLRVDEAALGWDARDVTTSGYPGPFHTYASMSHLLGRETWPADDPPASLAYFCHVLPTGASPPRDDTGYPERERALAQARAVRYLRDDIRHLWPAAVLHGDFRWDLLCDDSDTSGPARLDSQYVSANVDPSDRYVLSLPGTGRFRLRADESGYDNLFLAGDWTDSGLNAGCIEGAVVSGIQAANAVRALPLLARVAGFYLTHARSGDRPWPTPLPGTTSGVRS